MSVLQRIEPLSDVIFRTSLSLIFIIGGLGHFMQHDHMLSRIDQSPWLDLVLRIGSPSILLWLSGAVFVVAGIALVLGFKARLAALAMFVTLVPITFTIHVAPGHVGPLFKNVAILGALFLVMVKGPGAFSLGKEE